MNLNGLADEKISRNGREASRRAEARSFSIRPQIVKSSVNRKTPMLNRAHVGRQAIRNRFSREWALVVCDYGGLTMSGSDGISGERAEPACSPPSAVAPRRFLGEWGNHQTRRAARWGRPTQVVHGRAVHNGPPVLAGHVAPGQGRSSGTGWRSVRILSARPCLWSLPHCRPPHFPIRREFSRSDPSSLSALYPSVSTIIYGSK
jgi:hypothetical protein